MKKMIILKDYFYFLGTKNKMAKNFVGATANDFKEAKEVMRGDKVNEIEAGLLYTVYYGMAHFVNYDRKWTDNNNDIIEYLLNNLDAEISIREDDDTHYTLFINNDYIAFFSTYGKVPNKFLQKNN